MGFYSNHYGIQNDPNYPDRDGFEPYLSRNRARDYFERATANIPDANKQFYDFTRPGGQIPSLRADEIGEVDLLIVADANDGELARPSSVCTTSYFNNEGGNTFYGCTPPTEHLSSIRQNWLDRMNVLVIGDNGYISTTIQGVNRENQDYAASQAAPVVNYLFGNSVTQNHNGDIVYFDGNVEAIGWVDEDEVTRSYTPSNAPSYLQNFNIQAVPVPVGSPIPQDAQASTTPGMIRVNSSNSNIQCLAGPFQTYGQIPNQDTADLNNPTGRTTCMLVNVNGTNLGSSYSGFVVIDGNSGVPSKSNDNIINMIQRNEDCFLEPEVPDPVRYTCNTSNYTCEEAPNGEYTTLSACESNCDEPDIPDVPVTPPVITVSPQCSNEISSATASWPRLQNAPSEITRMWVDIKQVNINNVNPTDFDDNFYRRVFDNNTFSVNDIPNGFTGREGLAREDTLTLIPGQRYGVKVFYEYGGNQQGIFSNITTFVAEDCIGPSQADAPIVSCVDGNPNQVRINWLSAGQGANGYRVEITQGLWSNGWWQRSINSARTTSTVAPNNFTATQDSNRGTLSFEPGLNYRVRVFYEESSQRGNENTFTIDECQPPPVNLPDLTSPTSTCTQNTSRASLSWGQIQNAPSEVTRMWVDIKPVENNSTPTNFGNYYYRRVFDNNTFSVNNIPTGFTGRGAISSSEELVLIPGQTYAVKVFYEFGGNRQGLYSNTVTFVAEDCTVIPTLNSPDPTCVNGTSKATLSWAPISNSPVEVTRMWVDIKRVNINNINPSSFDENFYRRVFDSNTFRVNNIPDGFTGRAGLTREDTLTLVPGQRYATKVFYEYGGNQQGQFSNITTFVAEDCAEPTKQCFLCDTESYTCSSETVPESTVCDGSGEYYNTSNSCNNNCIEPTKQCFQCNQETFTCETVQVTENTTCDGTNGIYDSNNQCTQGCNEPTKQCFLCDLENYVCESVTVPTSTTCNGGANNYYSNENGCTNNCQPVPNPEITKEGSIDEINSERALIEYTIQVMNTPDEARVFDIRDRLPTGVDNAINISNGGIYNLQSNIILWEDIEIAESSSITLTYVLVVPSDNFGQLVNIASVLEIDSETVLDEDDETVNLVFDEPDITKSGELIYVDNTRAEIDYTLEVNNPNNFPIDNISVIDTLPDGVTDIDNISPPSTSIGVNLDNIVWGDLSFESFETKTFSYTIILDPSSYAPVGPEEIENLSELLINDEVVDEDSEIINVNTDIDLSLSKSSSREVSENEVIFDYIITLRNIGENNVVDYTVRDTLDSKINDSMVSNIDPDFGELNNGVITWAGLELNPGVVLTFTYTVTISRDNPGVYENIVVLIDENNDPVSEDAHNVEVSELIVPAIITPDPIVTPTDPTPPPAPAPQEPGKGEVPLPKTGLGTNHFIILTGALLILTGLFTYKIGFLNKFIDDKIVFTFLNSLLPYNDRVENVLERRSERGKEK